jgi:polygalacturonase
VTNRRDFLRTLGAGAALVTPLGAMACRPPVRVGSTPVSGKGWDLVPQILSRIVPPRFPDRDFDITRYGARPDASFDNTDAIRRAVDACSAAGGGRVVVPAGRFVTGPVHLKSNVNLHVSRGATLAFSRDASKYLPVVLTRFEGTEYMGLSPLIYAFEQENVGVSGEGTLDGQANEEYWWPWKGLADFGWKQGMPNYNAARQRLLAMAEDGAPVSRRVFGADGYFRPQFIQPYRCRNVLIENVTIVNSPMWEIHPVLSSNVTVRGVKITTHGPNNDGCDPESCRDVLIEHCTFDTGDDCIAIKAGRNRDGRRVAAPSENIVIRNCRMKDGHGGLTIGSEMSGGVRSVFVENCQLDSPHLEQALRFKTNAMRGGTIEHIYFRNITIGEVSNAVIQIDCLYEEGEKGPEKPIVRDIHIAKVTCQKSQYALQLRGFAASPIQDIYLEDCEFNGAQRPNEVQHVETLRAIRVKINGQAFGA